MMNYKSSLPDGYTSEVEIIQKSEKNAATFIAKTAENQYIIFAAMAYIYKQHEYITKIKVKEKYTIHQSIHMHPQLIKEDKIICTIGFIKLFPNRKELLKYLMESSF